MSDDWVTCELGQVMTLQRGHDLPGRVRRNGPVPVVSSAGVTDWHAVAVAPGPGVVTGRYGTIGEVFYLDGPYWPLNTTLYVRDFHGNDPKFVSYLLRTVDFASHSGKSGVPGINRNDIHKLMVAIPPLKEQEAIAEALGDADAAIEALDALIAKKRDVKQAAMQQLLTGRTLLPGFSEEWSRRRLGDFCRVVMGQSPVSEFYNTDGNGLPLIQGNADIKNRKTIERVWSVHAPKLARPGDVLLTVRAPVGAAARASAQVCLGRGVCALQPSDAAADFLFHALVFGEPRWVALEQGSTFTAANARDVAEFLIDIPSSISEQEAIAQVLSDLDDEIEALVAQRDKMRLVKQGMMQELLSGRVRLV